jgi:integrase
MARHASFEPVKVEGREKPWKVEVIAELSETGKRQRLFFDTKQKALGEIERLKARKDNFGRSLAMMSAARIAEAGEAYKLLEPHGVGLLDAVRGFLKRHAESLNSRPWKEVFEEYLAMPKKRRPKYLRDLKEAQEATRCFDAMAIADISPASVNKALSSLAPSTRNARLRILRAVFNYGIKRKLLRENPGDQLDFAQLERDDVEVLTVNQVSGLLNAALDTDLELLPWLVFGAFCGLRAEGELARLEWSHVNLPEKHVVVRVSTSKTSRRRTVKISDNALQWIEAYRQRGGTMEGRVVPLEKSALTKRRRALQKKAGIDSWIQAGLRHTFCSAWLMVHKDADELVLLSGHKDKETMWRHYFGVIEESEARRFWAIMPPTAASNVVAFQRSAQSFSNIFRIHSPATKTAAPCSCEPTRIYSRITRWRWRRKWRSENRQTDF